MDHFNEEPLHLECQDLDKNHLKTAEENDDGRGVAREISSFFITAVWPPSWNKE